MKKLLSFLFLSLSICMYSQEYSDYLGAGHSNGITVTTSSQQSKTNWNETASGNKTINGSGLDARLLETSRFLAQATFGTDLNYIKTVSENPFEDWIDSQFAMNSQSMGILTQSIYNQAKNIYVANGGNADDYFGPFWPHFQYAWWQSNIGNQDLLRQKVALALSEFLVISWDSALGDYGVGLGSYYDVLKDNAFGNFRELLLEMTLHPMMGGYLSHYNNPRSFPEQNIHPDENFAREVMQLFTIGLYELNQNGTYVLDSNGDRIPTYNNDDIKEFAKVFTGLGPAEVMENEWNVTANFGVGFYFAIKDKSMVMYDDWHQPGEKHLLNGYTVPSGQSGMKDIEDAIDNLFNHQNIAPFVSLRLIQQMVKSNPSPGYIGRVSAAFNNTKGVRGDMKAVIKAILLDEEARSCSWIENPTQGKLIEPMVRYFNVARQIDLNNQNNLNWNVGYNFFNATRQLPLAAPHVFNFYLPDYVPSSEFDAANLLGPEFQIHNSASSLAYVNEVDYWTYPQWYSILNTWDLGLENTPLDFEALKYYAKDSEVLVNQLDKLFTRGQLSNETKQIIIDAVDPINGTNTNVDYMHNRVKMALYLILISPDYVILK
ncbi:DUF1800 domain-containing protein [Flaviramulus sp. BrNp1-15]|uniref:DUF1800 domain-containing protein n=1 Tax=Flaviramulus sp. BrNp1-15 TaxID=2916754 RepID=UPI001EE8239F|nr:DUF1800 family protein [Flaviramulus sp. BrNp1-15]ULC60818.1 DUF1800 domain-containing protein [Flaviramulus sp. BrNp1-15]